MEINFNRARKGNPPLKQCRREAQKEHQPRSVAEIYTVREGIGMCLKSYKQNLQWRVCQSLGLFKCLETLLKNMATLINQFLGFLLH